MLIELEKNQLKKLLHRYSLTHIKPHPQVYSIKIPEQEIFIQNVSEQRKRRKIFYSVTYEPQEIAKIEELRRMMQHESITDNINDQLILKHIYAAKWDSKRTLQRIKEVIEFNKNPVVTRLNEQTIKKLENGCIYTYGHDRVMLPLVIMRVDKIDFKVTIHEIFNSVYYLLLTVKEFKMVPYHAEKIVLLIDFNDISFTSIPYFQLYDIIHKMGTYYCGLTQKVLLYNSEGISKIWKLINNFLPEYQKKKIAFIHKGQEKKVLEWVEETQLQKKYGGKLPNLNVFWPPKQSNQDISYQSESDEYFSVQNNLEFFDPAMQSASTCEKHCSCNIY